MTKSDNNWTSTLYLFTLSRSTLNALALQQKPRDRAMPSDGEQPEGAEEGGEMAMEGEEAAEVMSGEMSDAGEPEMDYEKELQSIPLPEVEPE